MPGGSSASAPERRMRVTIAPASSSRWCVTARGLDVDDQIVPHARQPEVADELRAAVERRRRGRHHLDHDHRIVDRHRVARRPLAAAHQRVRLVDGPLVDPHRHPVRHRLAAEPARRDPGAQRVERRELGPDVLDPLRGHLDDLARRELEAAGGCVIDQAMNSSAVNWSRLRLRRHRSAPLTHQLARRDRPRGQRRIGHIRSCAS